MLNDALKKEKEEDFRKDCVGSCNCFDYRWDLLQVVSE